VLGLSDGDRPRLNDTENNRGKTTIVDARVEVDLIAAGVSVRYSLFWNFGYGTVRIGAVGGS
jgi:hypothetical protein